MDWFGSKHVLAFLIVNALPISSVAAESAASIYAKAAPSTFLVSIRQADGSAVSFGTGFLVSANQVVTNLHVVQDEGVFVEQGSTRIPAIIEKRDVANDLALLKVNAEIVSTPLVLSTRRIAPGEPIFVIGNPEGLEKTISAGIVGGLRNFKGREIVQITAPVSHGSSGGPVLDSSGQVIAVTVAMLQNGQNLNFAVPSARVQELISKEGRNGNLPAQDLSLVFDKVNELYLQRAKLTYSAEADSPWQQNFEETRQLLQTALAVAGNDSQLLFRVAEVALYKNGAIRIEAAERIVRLTPNERSYALLGDALRSSASYSEEPQKGTLLQRAEVCYRKVLALSPSRSGTIHYKLADVQEDRGATKEANENFRRAQALLVRSDPEEIEPDSIRGLIRTSYRLGATAEAEKWFQNLVESGKVQCYDWQSEAERQWRLDKYESAGFAFVQAAASTDGDWRNLCDAADMYSLVTEAGDLALKAARGCIKVGTGVKDSEKSLALAHAAMASVLNDRGVFAEGLTHAREAIDLDSSSWPIRIEQARALVGLRRFHEAVEAAEEGLRLADGKSSRLHFLLGSAYYDLERWELARQSFEKVAEMSPGDTAAPYNVALCLVNLGYVRDAARWYREVLKRNPSYAERADLEYRIRLCLGTAR